MKDHPSRWISSGVTCREVTDRASEYLDDRLPLLKKVRIGLHLASCGHCRIYIKQMTLITETARLLPKPVPRAIDRLNLRRHFAACHGQQPAVSVSPAAARLCC